MDFALAPLAADDARWLELRLQMFGHHDEASHREEMRDQAAQPDRYGQFIATGPDGSALGFVEVALRHDYVVGTRSSPVAFLEAIYVVPGARRRGLARALVTQARAWSRARGCTEIASDALIDNTASHAMHRALGFVETERVVYFRQPLAD